MIKIRLATTTDLEFLNMLEKDSFDETRQSNQRVLAYSLTSKRQTVFIVDYDGVAVGSATVFKYQKTYRIYSIAVLASYRKMSLGKHLMQHILNGANDDHVERVTLEVDARKLELIRWYESFGFYVVKEIKDFYGLGEPALKMVLPLKGVTEPERKKTRNIVVVEEPATWLQALDNIDVVLAETYINDEQYQSLKGVRIFNLCNSYDYQSIGYYVSLLASARLQRVIPNVTTIKDFTDDVIIASIGDEEHDLIQKSLNHMKVASFDLTVIFGHCEDKKYHKLAKALYRLFEAPFLVFSFEKTRDWTVKKVVPITLSNIFINDGLIQSAKQYFSQKRFSIGRFKEYKYDLAILIDPDETTPPSCRVALSKFKMAAEKVGFFTEFITKDDYRRLTEFDALFIRATTNVNDYTYQFSRYAYAEGLAVIDDPWSILKCSNKLFIAESMKMEGVLTPKSVVLSNKTSVEQVLKVLGFPMILKQPDSAFSLGVFKVHDVLELENKLNKMLELSELVIVQEYVQSAFDWRIGVLDDEPLFACKYFMAKNHWQIYNWQTRNTKWITGNVETIPTEKVPKFVIDAAIKAAGCMGDGLYGVDIKEVNGKAYVIEVNDNPNVDYRWEDKVLEDVLYLRIMKSLFDRIENTRDAKRRISSY